jgi:hypothetical protein
MTPKIYDGKLYFFFGIVSLCVAVILGGISAYSKFLVEPKIRGYIETPDENGENYKKAYILLRNPQIFAGYEHFDGQSVAINKILETFDQMLYAGLPINPDHGQYLEVLLKRRAEGSALGFKTMFFVLFVSALSWALFLIEKLDLKKQPS